MNTTERRETTGVDPAFEREVASYVAKRYGSDENVRRFLNKRHQHWAHVGTWKSFEFEKTRPEGGRHGKAYYAGVAAQQAGHDVTMNPYVEHALMNWWDQGYVDAAKREAMKPVREAMKPVRVKIDALKRRIEASRGRKITWSWETC